MADLFSELGETDLLRHLLADLHDDLQGRTGRLRYLVDLGGNLGSHGTMLFGGHTAALAYGEARSSFVNGNFIATIVLCQALMEQTLAGFLHAGLMVEVPNKISFQATLAKCLEGGLITAQDEDDLKRLSGMRNPLTHFRHFDDPAYLDRRSLHSKEYPIDMLERDATFAIGLIVRILAKAPFRVG